MKQSYRLKGRQDPPRDGARGPPLQRLVEILLTTAEKADFRKRHEDQKDELARIIQDSSSGRWSARSVARWIRTPRRSHNDVLEIRSEAEWSVKKRLGSKAYSKGRRL